jgi:hypothetical protein
MAIFRSNFLQKIENKGFHIPLIKGLMYDFIKESYTGGSTDMFIPSNTNTSKSINNTSSNISNIASNNNKINIELITTEHVGLDNNINNNNQDFSELKYNNNIYGYDVNSLYPYVMSKKMFMPVISKYYQYVT